MGMEINPNDVPPKELTMAHQRRVTRVSEMFEEH